MIAGQQEFSGSPSGVRSVWLRDDLENRYEPQLRLAQQAHETTHVLFVEQTRLLERHSPDFRMRHVETNAPGELLNQDTFYWGQLKGWTSQGFVDTSHW